VPSASLSNVRCTDHGVWSAVLFVAPGSPGAPSSHRRSWGAKPPFEFEIVTTSPAPETTATSFGSNLLPSVPTF
jgi:hypothetical protein